MRLHLGSHAAVHSIFDTSSFHNELAEPFRDRILTLPQPQVADITTVIQITCPTPQFCTVRKRRPSRIGILLFLPYAYAVYWLLS